MNQKFEKQNYMFLDPYQGYQPGYPPQPYGKDGYPPPQGYPPNVGFANPGYPNAGYPNSQPQPSGFVPLVPPANNPYGNSPNIPPQHPGAFVDPEDLSQIKGFDFSEETIRRGFIRKVYSILSVSIYSQTIFLRFVISFSSSAYFKITMLATNFIDCNWIYLSGKLTI